MEIKYYISGLRPIKGEIVDDYEMYYAFQWETCDFKQDMRYFHEIKFDPSGDVEELSKEEFDKYVEKLKKEKGLT